MTSSTGQVLESSTGLLFKEKKRLITEDELLTLETEFKNLLRTGDSFHKIKKNDVTAVRAFDSGFRSLKAIIIGVFLVMIGLNSLEYSITLASLILGLGVLLILHGIQKEFQILVEYIARSPTQFVFIPGLLKFNGQGSLPITHEIAAIDFLNSNIAADQELASFRVKETFLALELSKKILRIGQETISIFQEGSFLRPKGFIVFPTKNLVSIRVNPASFRSLKGGILGVLLALIGISGILTARLATIVGSLFYLVFGILLVAWGFQRMVKLSLAYMVFGNRVHEVTVEGAAIDHVEMLHSLGEIAIQASVSAIGREKRETITM